MEGPSSLVIRSAAEYVPVVTSGEVDATPPPTFAQVSDLVTPSTLPESDLMGAPAPTQPSRATTSEVEGARAEDPMAEVMRRLAQTAQPPPQVAPPATDVLSQLMAALVPPPPPVTPSQPSMDLALSQLMEHLRRQAQPPLLPNSA